MTRWFISIRNLVIFHYLNQLFNLLSHLHMNTILTLDGLVEVCEFGSHGCDWNGETVEENAYE